MWFNGVKIHDQGDAWTGFHAGKERIAVTLRAGVNRLLVEIGDRPFFLGISDGLVWERELDRPLPSAAPSQSAGPAPQPLVLKAKDFRHFVDAFRQDDDELYVQHIPNTAAWDFLKANIPLLDCPDKEIEEIFYFRWWTFRKAIKQTPDGFIITEFVPPVGWAGKHNSINCAALHHLHEGRWLNDPTYLDDYSRFWFRKGGGVRSYSFPAADSIWARFLVTGDDRLPRELLPDLIENYDKWETSRRDANGLFWQIDDRDGMEESIGGSGYRATINSYMYGDAMAIARIAERFRRDDIARRFHAKAAEIRRLTQDKLWDPAAKFFKVLPRGAGAALADVRELHGYTPWYFALPDADKSVAWKQLMDPQGFYAPFGPTTAERRHPKFAVAYQGHECQWNGPSWPFSTAVTLTAMANLLNEYRQDVVQASDYFKLLKIYTKSQHRKRADGRIVPWIDENLNPANGDWISRTLLIQRKQGPRERGKDYNHSTYCDLVISGLIGLRPREDDVIEVNPLVPAGTWDYFCLDQVRYHGHWLTILYDKTGERYRRGKGLRVFADGRQTAQSPSLGKLLGQLPPAETSGGWLKSDKSPVMGGKYGTCFDIAVLKEGGTYRMWLSWRPQRSVALVESADGIHWSEPPRIVLGPRPETGWEEDINRPVVVKRADGYHMWYTGQAKGKNSWIGYATSPDGVTWKRMSQKPVLSFEQPWEKVAVMCPHVLWNADKKFFQMWYSGGEQYEPNAIGYATSPDGLTWTKCRNNPVFSCDRSIPWERDRVAGCQVEKCGDYYLMFFIGYRDIDHAQIGLARSKDGITGWERHPANPIIRPGQGKWDEDACYKPYAVFDGQKWLLWYNGRRGSLEQIGAVVHEGEDLGFDPPAKP